MKRFLGTFVICSAMTAWVLAAPGGSGAADEKFPDKNITWVIPFGPGGGYDNYSRSIGSRMREHLPNNVAMIFKNVHGAAGAIGANQVYSSKPDGCTIGVLNIPGHVVNQKFGNTEYKLENCTYIGNMGGDEYGLLVAKGSPYKSLQDLQKSEGLRFGSTGVGDPNHIYPLIAAKEMGLRIKGYVFYKSAPEAVLGLMRGDVDVFSMAYIQFAANDKETRALTIFSKERWKDYPDVPTVAEQGYPQMAGMGIERVIYGPPGMPEERRKVLEDAFWKGVTSPEIQEWAVKTKSPVRGYTKGKEARELVMRTFEVFSKYEEMLRKEIKQK